MLDISRMVLASLLVNYMFIGKVFQNIVVNSGAVCHSAAHMTFTCQYVAFLLHFVHSSLVCFLPAFVLRMK